MKYPIPFLAASSLVAQTGLEQSGPLAWVAKSNRNAQIPIALNAKYGPEGASSEGVPGLDEKISVFSADESRRHREDLVKARHQLQANYETGKDPLVRQDLQILIGAADRQIRSIDANEKTFLPYGDVAGLIFFGEKRLMDPQVAAERHAAAVVRLRKYTGLEPGYTPIVEQAEARFREKIDTPGLLGPSKMEVEKDLGNTQSFARKFFQNPAPISVYPPLFTKVIWRITASITRPKN
jgi:hypothetical protein